MLLLRRGFTVVEVVMVMVILGIVVAIAAPKIDTTTYRVNSAIQVLGTSMLTAQRQAVTQQHNIIVYLDSVNNQLRIHQDRDNSGVIDNGEHVRAVNLGEGVVFGRGAAPAMAMGAGPIVVTKEVGGLQAIVFHRDGSASEAGGFYVTSARAQAAGSRPQDARAVRVERATGRASWFRYRSTGWDKQF